MVGSKRMAGESFEESIRRKTRFVRSVYIENRLEPLVVTTLKRYFRLATAMEIKGEENEFVATSMVPNALRWNSYMHKESEKFSYGSKGVPFKKRRIRIGGPGKRWDEIMVAVFGYSWELDVEDGSISYDNLVEFFVDRVLTLNGLSPQKIRGEEHELTYSLQDFETKKKKNSEEKQFKRRKECDVDEETELAEEARREKEMMFWHVLPWADHNGGNVQLQMVGDCKIVTEMLDGKADMAAKGNPMVKLLYTSMDAITNFLLAGVITPSHPEAPVCLHIRRNHNELCDELSKRGRLGEVKVMIKKDIDNSKIVRMRGHFDGSYKDGAAQAGIGWCLEIQLRNDEKPEETSEWLTYIMVSTPTIADNSLESEIAAYFQLSNAIFKILNEKELCFDMLGKVM